MKWGTGRGRGAARHLVHRLLAHAAAHAAQQRASARAVGSSAEHILVRVEVRRSIKGIDSGGIVHEHRVRVAGAHAD